MVGMRLLATMLRRLVRHGELSVIAPDGKSYRFGALDPELKPVAIRLVGRKTPRDIVRDPALGAAEAWIEGRLTMERGDILDLVKLIRRNARWEEKKRKQALRRGGSRALARLDRLNWRRWARRNVAHHYDLGNFALRALPGRGHAV